MAISAMVAELLVCIQCVNLWFLYKGCCKTLTESDITSQCMESSGHDV